MIWVLSPTGKRMPLDARPFGVLIQSGVIGPNAANLTRYNTEDRGGELHAVKDAAGAYVSHFQTCPNAGQHTRR